jgi:neutral/alkaline ceramidase-like enzyme
MKTRDGWKVGISVLVAAALFLTCLTASAFAAPADSSGTLQAGVAQVDITPPAGLPMYGYFDRITKHQVSTGTLDPLYARVVMLEAGNKRVALVTLDLGRTFDESWLERLRSVAKQESRIDQLVVTASHTHSGPNILDVYPEGHPPEWQSVILRKIGDAIHQAASRLEPVQLGTGYGEARIGYNRRQIHSDNTITMLWSNPDKIPSTPVDVTVSVIRIDRRDGTPLAILVNHACHPVVFGADHLQYSADYVSTMVETVTAGFPGKPICLFLQGADGDINPYYATTMNRGAVEKRNWTGRELGTEALRVAKEIRTKPSAGSLDFAEDVMVFPLRWDAQKFHDDLLRVNGPLVFQDHAGAWEALPLPTKLALHVTTLLINRQIAIVGMPGEPFVDFQINLRDRCPVRDCMLLGYTNGYFDYFPTILAASQGGYGAGDSNTYVAVGAGERMLDHAVVRIYEMLGELKPVPGAEND